ncbi:hypothetical protein [Streptomyces toxytricini]|uniref:hypothetical protein n=1 Tax=Streptomyces toxytricini TaxID=67369 RepID=UPI00342194F4
MRRRLLLSGLPVVAALVLAAGLVSEDPLFGWWKGQTLGTARIRQVLPPGTDVAGYRVVSVEPERIDQPSPDRMCGAVASAITSPDHAPSAATRLILGPVGETGQGESVVSYSFSEDDAKSVMKSIRAALPSCAHYNAWYADLYTRHGLRPAQSPSRVGDDRISYRRLDPPPGDTSSDGSPVPMAPGPLQEPGRTTTFVRTGGVITRYPDAVPQAVVEDVTGRFRRAASG